MPHCVCVIFVHGVYVIAYTPHTLAWPSRLYAHLCRKLFIVAAAKQSPNLFIIQSWLIALHSPAAESNRLELLFISWLPFILLFLLLLLLMLIYLHFPLPLLLLIPFGFGSLHSALRSYLWPIATCHDSCLLSSQPCLYSRPTHPFLDPLATFTFCVFDVLADIAKQLSSHVSYRPEFPCHRALLVFGLRLRLCLGGSSAHTKYSWPIITDR